MKSEKDFGYLQSKKGGDMVTLGKYKVKWFHDNQQPLNQIKNARKSGIFTRRNDEDTKPKHSVTTCEIYDIDDNWVTTGTAICQPEDNFNKRTGRKISLDRALKNGINVLDRGLIWIEFFDKWPEKR